MNVKVSLPASLVGEKLIICVNTVQGILSTYVSTEIRSGYNPFYMYR